MRVLHLTPFYAPAWEWGGPVAALSQLVRAQVDLGLRVVVATTTRRGGHRPDFPPGLRHRDGAEVHYHRAVSASRFFFAPTLLAQVLAGGYDLLHVHGLWTFSTLIGSLGLPRTPWVLTPHGGLEAWALRQKALKKRVYLNTAGRLLARASAIHFTTAAEARLSRALADQPQAIIPLPVDIERFAEVPPVVSPAARKRRGDPFTLLFLGRLHAVKGMELLLPALAEARHEVNVQLVIAGPDEANYRPRLRRAMRGLGLDEHVVLRGLLGRGRVAEALASAHALVLPSHQESFGLAAAEAMAAGRAVLVSEHVGVADAVRAANAGWVLPLEHAAWVDGIVQAARTTSPELGQRGRDYARQHWHPREVAEALRGLYRQVLA